MVDEKTTTKHLTVKDSINVLKKAFKSDSKKLSDEEAAHLHYLQHVSLKDELIYNEDIRTILADDTLKINLVAFLLLNPFLDEINFGNILLAVSYKKDTLPHSFFQKLIMTKHDKYIPAIYDEARKHALPTDFINMLMMIATTDEKILDVKTFRHIFQNEVDPGSQGFNIIKKKDARYQEVIKKLKSHYKYCVYCN